MQCLETVLKHDIKCNKETSDWTGPGSMKVQCEEAGH